VVPYGSRRSLTTRRPRRAVPVAWLLLLSAAGCGNGDHGAGRAARHGTIAVVIKGVENPFFATMRDGVMATVRANKARLAFSAAGGLYDTAGQASALESLGAERASCYVVNPINKTNLVEPLSHVAKGRPIVNIDSPVDQEAAKALGVRITAYVGTDNLAAGRLAADAMARSVDRGTRVAVIGGYPGDAPSESRIRGFTDGAHGRFDVIQITAADYDRGRGRLAAEEILRARPPVQGVFAVNDEMALGTADAVAAAGEGRPVAVIGLDGTPEALEAVKSGALSATIAQYPYVIGQLGVEACLATIRGKSVPANIVAPVQVVTPENVARAQATFPRPVEPFHDGVAELLNP
jgi:ABC-type sugar transport system substrate-binding protein